MNTRTLRQGSIVKEVLSEVILKELPTKPGILITITEVAVSADLRHAKVFISVFPEKYIGTCLTLLKKHIKMLQSSLRIGMGGSGAPKVTFFIDKGLEKEHKIEQLLGQAQQNQVE